MTESTEQEPPAAETIRGDRSTNYTLVPECPHCITPVPPGANYIDTRRYSAFIYHDFKCGNCGKLVSVAITLGTGSIDIIGR